MKRIFLTVSFFIITITSFSQTGASYDFGNVGSWWFPKLKLYGTSTYWMDSTNYQTTNKSIYVHDSLKVGRWLYVGVRGSGGIYLDTGNSGQILFNGFDLGINNVKPSGQIQINSANMIELVADSTDIIADRIRFGDDGGAYEYYFDETGIWGLQETQQIKLPKDTVSDYASADAVTINRQSGTVTTKSLTTASGNDYTITINNSLVSATTNVWAMIKTNSGSGAPLVRQCATGSGTITVIIRNLGSGSLNSAISFQFLLVN